MKKSALIEKVEQLPASLRKEVENFVDFLIYKKKDTSSIYFVEEIKTEYNHNKNPLKIDTLKPKPVFGSGKGLFGKIADDFDAPLDEMKEYM